MAKLVWDSTGERWYENGVRNVALYVRNGASGAYSSAVAWNGVTAITENPDGAEPTDLYADDIKYASFRSTETYGLTIEAYQYPESFGLCDGTAEPATGVFLGQQKRIEFALVWKTQIGNDTKDDSDDAYKLHIAYGLSASPSEKNYETINDSPDAITFSWECESDPVAVTGYKPVSCITIDSRTANATKLTALETTLFGSSSTDGALVLPDAVITAMSGTT